MKWHGAWLYGVHRTRRDGSSFMRHQPCQLCKYTTSVDIKKTRYKKLVTRSCRITCERSESAREQRTALYKAINNNNFWFSYGQIVTLRTGGWTFMWVSYGHTFSLELSELRVGPSVRVSYACTFGPSMWVSYACTFLWTSQNWRWTFYMRELYGRAFFLDLSVLGWIFYMSELWLHLLSGLRLDLLCVWDIAVPSIRTSLSGVWSSDMSELWLDILCESLSNLSREWSVAELSLWTSRSWGWTFCVSELYGNTSSLDLSVLGLDILCEWAMAGYCLWTSQSWAWTSSLDLSELALGLLCEWAIWPHLISGSLWAKSWTFCVTELWLDILCGPLSLSWTFYMSELYGCLSSLDLSGLGLDLLCEWDVTVPSLWTSLTRVGPTTWVICRCTFSLVLSELGLDILCEWAVWLHHPFGLLCAGTGPFMWVSYGWTFYVDLSELALDILCEWAIWLHFLSGPHWAAFGPSVG